MGAYVLQDQLLQYNLSDIHPELVCTRVTQDGQHQNVVTQSLLFFGQPVSRPDHSGIAALNPRALQTDSEYGEEDQRQFVVRLAKPLNPKPVEPIRMELSHFLQVNPTRSCCSVRKPLILFGGKKVSRRRKMLWPILARSGFHL
jgi:hypothetical protein